MKNIYNKVKTAFLPIVLLVSLMSCMKDFLDVKRDKSQVVPRSLEDYRAILDHHLMNYNSSYLLGEIGSDDYYVAEEQWQAVSVPAQKNAYIWANEIYEDEQGVDWNRAYEKILYANFVLEGVVDINETPLNKSLRDELIGAAHFYRGTNFFLLAQLFCKQYDAATAHQDLGLPLRTTSNINVRYQRATLEQTYSQIISDLQTAALLLPHNMSFNTRPWRPAALGMLANTFLQKGDYQSARNYVDSALALSPEILDYNEVDTESNTPFPQYGRGNEEIIFYSHMANAAVLATSRLAIDSLLFDSYNDQDLRKHAFFFDNNGRTTFKGSYSAISSFLFSGLTTPEMFLVRAECNARLGQTTNAVADLNHLLSKRFTPKHFEPIGDQLPQSELLELVLSERRKELVFRGRRWHDLKRFAKDPDLAKPLKRVLGSLEYTLPLNSPRWVWPIPSDAVRLGGIEQNER